VSKRILQFSETIEANPQSVDKFIFSGGLLLLVVIVGSILIAPQWSAMAIERFYVFITTRMGVFYVIAAILTLGFLLFIAISSHGDLVLGPDDGPEYGRYSWASMLFCAGIAASLIYWGATEWTFYYIAPPFGIEPESDAALLMANSYGMFHWGPIGWAFCGLAVSSICCSLLAPLALALPGWASAPRWFRRHSTNLLASRTALAYSWALFWPLPG
jgi:choline-glycine betaine transporter